MTEGQVVKIAEGKPVANVPIRIASVLGNIKNVLNADGIQLRRSDIVNGVGIGVGTKEEEVLAEPLL